MSIEAYDYGKKDGAAEERERIIKLIEKDMIECPLADCDFCVVAKDLITLIKGEDK